MVRDGMGWVGMGTEKYGMYWCQVYVVYRVVWHGMLRCGVVRSGEVRLACGLHALAWFWGGNVRCRYKIL